jgi:hypothetical protein
MTNSLYGNRFIEKLVSSGYKNPTYAMAEIIDNSVDANAKNIDIVLVEEITQEGGRLSRFISEVFFIDDGTGMNLEQINGCLKFSEGAGTANSRIGTFGVGLPNSSIFVGRRVEVYSKDKSTGKWNFVFLDLDDQANRKEAGYDMAIETVPSFEGIDLDLNLSAASTIIRWSKVKNIGARQPRTVIDRTSKLIGRIYRHVLNDINITCGSVIKDNRGYEIPKQPVLPYDPLFLIEFKSYITDLIWELATTQDSSKGKIMYNDVVPENKEFNTQFHYKKYIEGCKKNETIRPLFQKLDNYWDLIQSTTINGKVYSYKIRAAFATKSVAHPGIGAGGKTPLGQEIRKKMTGEPHFNGGNISFVRTRREIDCGNYGLYSLTTEKERFWTIEIEFDSSLDRLMGLDYQKQNVAFREVKNEEVSGLENLSYLGENEQQLLIFNKITNDINNCRNEMMKVLGQYARDFRTEQDAASKLTKGFVEVMPEAEPAVFRALPKSEEEWTIDQKEKFTDFLKGKYLSLSKESISSQVEKFAQGLHKTVVLYNEDETGNLFEIKNVRGRKVTFINTNHIFYENIIAPLKDNKTLNIFTSAIEMLICTYAYEMDAMIEDNAKDEALLREYLRKISDRLQRFISEGQVSVDTEYWQQKLAKVDEQEYSETED